MQIFTLIAVLSAFTLSAAAGFGGSLIMVPVLTLTLGAKQGVALAALLLAWNNLFKLIAYRKFVKEVWLPGLSVTLLTLVGVGIGAKLLVAAPESWVQWTVIVSFLVTLGFELWEQYKGEVFQFHSKVYGFVLAFMAGATSGFSGTSGPLKGIALRNLKLGHMHLVAAASIVSFGGDLLKAGIFAEAGLITQTWTTLLWAIPLMLIGTYLGWWLNQRLGDRWFTWLFWVVIGAYSLRLVGLWF